jgi:hypothetical protein
LFLRAPTEQAGLFFYLFIIYKQHITLTTSKQAAARIQKEKTKKAWKSIIIGTFWRRWTG